MNEKTNKKGFGAWFRDNWKNNALFSTGIALIVMVILQTLALGFDYASFGEWFGAGLTTGSTFSVTTRALVLSRSA